MSSETFGGLELGRMCGYVVVSGTKTSLKSVDLLSPFPKSVPWLSLPGRPQLRLLDTHALDYAGVTMETNGCQKRNQVIKVDQSK